MAEFGVGFKLTADASQFQREMRAAVESSKDIRRGLSDIGIGGFSIAAAVTAIVGSFVAAAKGAQNLRDEAKALGREVDANVAATAKLVDTIEAGWTGFKRLGVEAVSKVFGTLAQVGDELGRGFLTATEGATKASADAAEKITEEAEKNIARLTAARKQFLETQAKEAIEADRKIAEMREARAMKEASDGEKLGMILAKQLELENALAATNENSLRYKQLQIELEKNLTAENEVRASLAKSQNEQEQRAAKQLEELEKDRQKAGEENARTQERLLQLKFEQLKPEEQLAILTREESQIRESIARMKANDLDTSYAEVALIETQNQLLGVQNRLRESGAQAAKAANAEAQAATEAARLATQAFNDAITAQYNLRRNPSVIEGASDEELRAFIKKTRDRIAAIDTAPLSLAEQVSGGFGRRFEKIPLTADLSKAEQELALRQSLRRDFELGGESLARRNFQGDPLAFDSLFQRFVEDSRSSQEIAKEQTTQLKDLNSRLARVGFTK